MWGETPLHVVLRGEYSQQNSIDLVRLLLERGVYVDARKVDGSTALHVAAFDGRPEIVRVLLDHGANANEQNGHSEAPIHLISQESHEHGVGVALMLLEHGVDVNYPNKDHDTPLHTACYFGRLEIAQVLLVHGAEASSENHRAQTPLHLVSQGRSWFQHDGPGVARLLLENGADMDAQDKDHMTPLHLACYHGRFDIARMLLDYDEKTRAEKY